MRASYTFDTATQASTDPATVRSTLWCTPSLRAKMLAELPQGSPGGQWIELDSAPGGNHRGGGVGAPVGRAT